MLFSDYGVPKLTGKAINDKDEEFELRVPAFLEFEETEFRTDFDERIVKKDYGVP